MSTVKITELDVTRLSFGKIASPKDGAGKYVNVMYDAKPLTIAWPLMFSWGAVKDDRKIITKDAYNLNLQFPKASDEESSTPELKLALEKALELEKAIHTAGVVNAAKWFDLVEDENGVEVPRTRSQITMGHSESNGAILKYASDKLTKKLIKNDKERPPGLKFKLQQDKVTKAFQCSIFNEKLKMIYCPQNAKGTIPDDITNANVLELIPKFSKVKCMTSLTIWIQGSQLMPSFTLQQAQCYQPTNMKADLTQCLFDAPTEDEHKQMQTAAATAVSVAVDDDNATDALQVEDSDDDAEVVMPVAVAVKKSAPAVVVPAAPVPAPAAAQEDDGVEEEDDAPKTTATKKVVTKKVVKKVVK